MLVVDTTLYGCKRKGFANGDDEPSGRESGAKCKGRDGEKKGSDRTKSTSNG